MARGDLMVQTPASAIPAATAMDPIDRLLVGGREAARLLGMSQRSIERHGLPSIRIGGRRLYSVDALRAWIAERLAAEGAQ